MGGCFGLVPSRYGFAEDAGFVIRCLFSKDEVCRLVVPSAQHFRFLQGLFIVVDAQEVQVLKGHLLELGFRINFMQGLLLEVNRVPEPLWFRYVLLFQLDGALFGSFAQSG